jgi:hypothetical protein
MDKERLMPIEHRKNYVEDIMSDVVRATNNLANACLSKHEVSQEESGEVIIKRTPKQFGGQGWGPSVDQEYGKVTQQPWYEKAKEEVDPSFRKLGEGGWRHDHELERH